MKMPRFKATFLRAGGFILLLFLIVPLMTQAQDRSAPSKSSCTENVIGVANGYVIFTCDAKGDHKCTISKDQCACAVKKFRGAKGCVDGRGQIMKTSVKNPNAKIEAVNKPRAIDPVTDDDEGADDEEEAEDEVTMEFHVLTGQTNCRLSSEIKAYITIVKNGTREEVMAVPGGEGKNSRFNFTAVEAGNHAAGFYIMTRASEPQVLMADGTELSLRNFNSMDGKMRELAKWKFFINGTDAQGNAKYQLMPLDNPDKLMLASDNNTNRLEMIKLNIGPPDSFVSKGKERVVPAPKSKNWNCECVF